MIYILKHPHPDLAMVDYDGGTPKERSQIIKGNYDRFIHFKHKSNFVKLYESFFEEVTEAEFRNRCNKTAFQEIKERIK